MSRGQSFEHAQTTSHDLFQSLTSSSRKIVKSCREVTNKISHQAVVLQLQALCVQISIKQICLQLIKEGLKKYF